MTASSSRPAVIRFMASVRTYGMRVLPVLLVVAVSAVGCGSEDARDPGSSGATGSTATAPKSRPSGEVVRISEFKFVPEDMTVDAGTTVRWTNADSAPHTATADDGSFDTGNLREGQTGKAALREPGTYTYFCEFHKFMRAKITVR